MAKNMFEKYAADRKVEREKIEMAVALKINERNERRTTLSLAPAVGDKKAPKKRAIKERAVGLGWKDEVNKEWQRRK